MPSDSFNSLGLGTAPPNVRRADGTNVEHVITQRPLQRVLGFTGHSIDDVVNSSVAKNHVRGYFKLYKWLHRGIEINDLERQWNLIEP